MSCSSEKEIAPVSSIAQNSNGSVVENTPRGQADIAEPSQSQTDGNVLNDKTSSVKVQPEESFTSTSRESFKSLLKYSDTSSKAEISKASLTSKSVTQSGVTKEGDRADTDFPMETSKLSTKSNTTEKSTSQEPRRGIRNRRSIGADSLAGMAKGSKLSAVKSNKSLVSPKPGKDLTENEIARFLTAKTEVILVPKPAVRRKLVTKREISLSRMISKMPSDFKR